MRNGGRVRIGAVIALALGTTGCDWMTPKAAPGTMTEAEKSADQTKRLRRACASSTTYDRLKELAFDEARRIRNVDSPLLDKLAAATVIRMEEPVLKSRDEDLNVTVCTGRMIVELPPGAQDVFNGEQRLLADIEYAAQEAADGSGLVYQMEGAEPIIYRLAAIDMKRGAPAMADREDAEEPLPPVGADEAEEYAEVDAPEPAPEPDEPAPPPVRQAPPPPPPLPSVASAQPSFNCRYARTRSERMVCSSNYLAGKDRTMSSLFYGSIAAADPETKAEIRASRDAFLRRREACGTEDCVGAVYDARIRELRRYGYLGE